MKADAGTLLFGYREGAQVWVRQIFYQTEMQKMQKKTAESHVIFQLKFL